MGKENGRKRRAGTGGGRGWEEGDKEEDGGTGVWVQGTRGRGMGEREFSKGRDARQDVRGSRAHGERERKTWMGKGMGEEVGRKGAGSVMERERGKYWRGNGAKGL